MKINFCHSPCKKKESERRYLKKFLCYYAANYLEDTLESIEISCPDHSEIKAEAPDFYIKHLDMAIEVKRVIDKKFKEKFISLSHNERRLQEALGSFLVRSKYKKENIFLGYPFEMKIKRGHEKKVAQIIIENILNGKDCFEIDKIGHFKVIHRSNSDKLRIILASTSYAWWESINEHLIRLIRKANFQLNSIPRIKMAKKKVLLLIEGEQYITLIDFINAMKDIKEKIEGEISINEIWLQIDRERSCESHHLLWINNMRLD